MHIPMHRHCTAPPLHPRCIPTAPSLHPRCILAAPLQARGSAVAQGFSGAQLHAIPRRAFPHPHPNLDPKPNSDPKPYPKPYPDPNPQSLPLT